MTKQNNIPNIGDETFNKIIQVQNLFTDLIQERSSIGRPPNLNLSDVAVILIAPITKLNHSYQYS